MGVWGAIKFVFGTPDYGRYARPSCTGCHGTGLRDFGTGHMERCGCVWDNIMDMRHAQDRQVAEQREHLESMRAYYANETDEQRRQRVLGPPPADRLSPEQARRDNEILVRRQAELDRPSITPAMQAAARAGQITSCCFKAQCTCRRNVWMINGMPTRR